jgi:hypothetical protein
MMNTPPPMGRVSLDLDTMVYADMDYEPIIMKSNVLPDTCSMEAVMVNRRWKGSMSCVINGNVDVYATTVDLKDHNLYTPPHTSNTRVSLFSFFALGFTEFSISWSKNV